MTLEPLTTITIEDLQEKAPFITEYNKDILITSVSKEYLDFFRNPCRIDAFVLALCVKGHLEINLNMQNYQVSPNTILINTPANLFQLKPQNETEDIEFFVVVVSSDLLTRAIKQYHEMIDFFITFQDQLLFTANDHEMASFKRLFLFIEEANNSYHLKMKENIIESLISALFYYLYDFTNTKALMHENNDKKSQREKILKDFLSLVNKYHTKERNVTFYAEKLYLTPKYLSKIIKSISNKTVMEWINAFVISEAKSLLVYSNKSINHISATLNFQTHSVFSKYFKRLTNLTPHDYRTTYGK